MSKVIKAPREKVFDVVATPESMLEWWPGAESVEVLSREGNTIIVKGTGTMEGREFTMTEKWTLYPPEKIELELLEGPFYFSTIQTFEEVPEGTKLTWSSDISFKGVVGKILSLFAGSKLKDFSAQTLDELAKYVEAQQAKTQ